MASTLEPQPSVAVRVETVPRPKSLLRFITCGSVDDGKSTLIGRLLYEAGTLFEDQMDMIETLNCAIQAGAITRSEARQGKGNVIRRMFPDIEADIYVMVDGDGTYDVASAPALIAKPCEERLDMVVATRVATDEAFRRTIGLGMIC